MSDNDPRERVDMLAFSELSELVRHLGDELSAFRRRALQAEGRVRALESAGATATIASVERLAELERENLELRTRLEAATVRTRQMLERVHFLRQQAERGGER